MNIQFFYKLSKSVIPMVLLTLSVGWCYAWSLFAGPIAEHIGVSKIAVQFIFCLNIFFLGMGAAFFGNLVEKAIKKSALLSTVLLFSGFMLSSLGLYLQQIWLLYIGSGVCTGLAQGISYVISPKNLLLWWNKTKYKATIMSLSIICFGLGSSVCSLLFNALYPILGIQNLMLVLGLIYTVSMLIATWLINKPKFALAKIKKTPTLEYKAYLSKPIFWKIWTFMFLNISAGLILIGNCASILKTINLSSSMIITVMFICGIANGLGRLIFPLVTDFLKRKTTICILILGIELCLVFPTMFIYTAIPLMIILINATYGSAFAVLPSLVSYEFGTKYLSAIHGLILSSWGIASLFAYICTTVLQSCQVGVIGILVCIAAMYAINFFNTVAMKH